MIFPMNKDGVNYLGRLGENQARVGQFEIGDVLKEHPAASFTLVNKPYGYLNGYPVAPSHIEVQGDRLLWTITSSDLTQIGFGECELIATEGSVIVKDDIYRTRVNKALDNSATPPSPWESYVQDVEDAADRAEAAAELLENPGAEAETQIGRAHV